MTCIINGALSCSRFHVYRDIIRPEKLDRSVSLHGADYIDVPAMDKKNYELHFYSYKEFSLVAKVNADTLQSSMCVH